MPRLEFSEHFVDDLSLIKSSRIESQILNTLSNLEVFGELGSPLIPDSIKHAFGDGVRKIAINPFDLIYTYYADLDLVRVEALVHQRSAW